MNERKREIELGLTAICKFDHPSYEISSQPNLILCVSSNESEQSEVNTLHRKAHRNL